MHVFVPAPVAFLACSSANKCLLKVAHFRAQLEQYEQAIEIYEQVSVRYQLFCIMYDRCVFSQLMSAPVNLFCAIPVNYRCGKCSVKSFVCAGSQCHLVLIGCL